MQQPDPKLRQQLAQAHELFNKRQYSQSKKLLQQTKTTHLSIELNSLLCDYKEDKAKIAPILRKIMDILITVNIKLYQQRPQKGKKRTPKISHELYFWNIIVLSQLLPNPQVTELIGNEALHFLDSLRTETSLMILHQMLKIQSGGGRLASCITLIEQQNRLMAKVKKLTPEEQSYRFLNQTLYCKVLLKLGMIDGGRIMYMMKFNQTPEEPKQGDLTEIGHLPISIYQQLLHAQIEYHAKNYQHVLKLLAELTTKLEGLGKHKQQLKHIIDHNVALVLANMKQTAAAKMMLSRTLQYFTKEKEQSSNQRAGMAARCRDNLMLIEIAHGRNWDSAYQGLKNQHNCYSYLINYRKAQLCLNYYHQLLKNPEKVLSYQEIHDFYDTVYYYPNQPYFQQKGKNRNPNYTSRKFFYRRYVLSPGQTVEQPPVVNVHHNGSSEVKQVKKEPSKEKRSGPNKKKGKKEEEPKEDPVKEEVFAIPQPQNVLKEILKNCEWFLKQALIILEKQKSTIVNLHDEQKGLTEQVNEKLYNDYISYKGSILNLLCYVSLCQQEWQQTVRHATLYQAFEKQYQAKLPDQKQQTYNILTYKLQALAHLNRLDHSYNLLHDLATNASITGSNNADYAGQTSMECCSSAPPQTGQVYFEQMTPYSNFAYNLSVLHSKDNKIPEAFNSIQKLMQHMREMPTNPKANLPLSTIELLTHYNLRTSNQSSALQLIKRRRILTLPGVIGHYNPTLGITK